MRHLKSAVLAATALFATSALATNPNIVFSVSAQPASVTQSRPSLQTFAAYQITIANDSPFTAKAVKLKGSTTVLGASDSAPFVSVSANGPSCSPIYAPPSTAVECQIGVLAGGASVSFSLTFAAPASGTQIKFASQTFHQRIDSYYVFASPVKLTFTDLDPPNPLMVATFLPAATGGTVFTGANGGVALTADTGTTTVAVPRSSSVEIDETADPDAPPCPSNSICPIAFSNLTIPGLFEPFLTITLRRDVSTIPKKPPKHHDDQSLRQDDNDDDFEDDEDDDRRWKQRRAKIGKAKIFYKADPTPANPFPQYAEVSSCSVTGGPVAETPTSPGRPCVASRTAYKKRNAPTPDYVGDWEFVILAKNNGFYRF